jgi:hypothetical protein
MRCVDTGWYVVKDKESTINNSITKDCFASIETSKRLIAYTCLQKLTVVKLHNDINLET